MKGAYNMTIMMIKTNEKEADRIIENKVRFMFRSESDNIREGDIITFRCIKAGKEILHKIGNKRYVVTGVMDHTTAPILAGYKFVAFRDM